jgi:hypothetical protein
MKIWVHTALNLLNYLKNCMAYGKSSLSTYYKMYVLFHSATFVWNIFCFNKCLVSYTQDILRNICQYSYKVVIKIVIQMKTERAKQ